MVRNLLFVVLGITFVFFVAWLMSFNRKRFEWKTILRLFIIEVFIAFITLKTSIGLVVIKGISDMFQWILKEANVGINFVFGGFAFKNGQMPFFFTVLMPIVVIVGLIGILNYIKVLPFIMKVVGKTLSKLTGIGELESYLAVATTTLGQPEVYYTIPEAITTVDRKRVYTIGASAMSSVSAAVLASYMLMINPRYVVVAVFLNIFSALIVATIVNPYDKFDDEGLYKTPESDKGPFFSVFSEYLLNGFKTAIIIGAILMGFVAVISMIDTLTTMAIGISFTQILGYAFSPIAFIMGVQSNEIFKVGQVMAMKLVTNEFVAMGEIGRLSGQLSERSIAIISTYVVSFANFSTIGIFVGSLKSFSEDLGKFAAKNAVKLLAGSTLASVLTGTLVGAFI